MNKIKKRNIALLLASTALITLALNLTQTLYGFTLLLLLPGYALTLALFPEKRIDMWERTALTINLSISTCVISVFALNYFLKIPITTGTLSIEILALTGIYSIIYLTRRPKPTQKNGVNISSVKNTEKTGKNIISAFTVILILALTFSLVYKIHWDYDYPYHTDEWQHIAQGIQITEEKHIRLTNPYYRDKPYTYDLEIGFHVFLAELTLLTGRDLILYYKFLPAIFACISSFTLFVFAYKTTGKFLAGILSMLFFASLKSNIFLLGPWFYVPLTMSFPLLYLILYSMTEGIRKGSLPHLLSATITLLALSLIHPSIASFAYMTITLYLIFAAAYSAVIIVLHLASKRKHLTEKFNSIVKYPIQRVSGILAMFLIPLLSFLYFLRFLRGDSLTEKIGYFTTKFMIFEGALPVKELYNPLFLYDIYGVTGFSLALAGVFYSLMKKRGVILVSGISIALALTILYQLRGFIILILYERTLYCALLCLAPLSGIGLYVLTYFIRNIPRRFSRGVLVSTAIILSLLLLVFLNVFSDYYTYKDKIYKMIDDDDYRAIKWLGENRGEHNIVLARPRISDAIYPISRNYVVAITPHGPSNTPILMDTKTFLTSGCEGRKTVLEKYQVDYVLVNFKIKCDFLEEIYHQGEDYIYETQIT